MSQNPIEEDMKIFFQNKVQLPLIFEYNEFDSTCFLHALCSSMNIEISLSNFYLNFETMKF